MLYYTSLRINLCIVAGYLLLVTSNWQQVTGNYKKDDYTFLSGMQYKTFPFYF